MAGSQGAWVVIGESQTTVNFFNAGHKSNEQSIPHQLILKSRLWDPESSDILNAGRGKKAIFVFKINDMPELLEDHKRWKRMYNTAQFG
jgi:hypothetical protein